MATTATAAWPTGVIARYLTVGGATVDLAHGDRYYPTKDGIGETRNHTSVACTGCQASEEISHWFPRVGSYGGRWEEHHPEVADEQARAWAQTHAETCRAMPKPTA
ncbi:hypothetical protein ACFVZR_07620 [Streptomyces sp. NPDC058316]|uniref:hypothetical protein n=1 Tax=Streptomyces sp. NPDC058316 TaxID=3346442 RepID=UPI0036E472AD